MKKCGVGIPIFWETDVRSEPSNSPFKRSDDEAEPLCLAPQPFFIGCQNPGVLCNFRLVKDFPCYTKLRFNMADLVLAPRLESVIEVFQLERYPFQCTRGIERCAPRISGRIMKTEEFGLETFRMKARFAMNTFLDTHQQWTI